MEIQFFKIKRFLDFGFDEEPEIVEEPVLVPSFPDFLTISEEDWADYLQRLKEALERINPIPSIPQIPTNPYSPWIPTTEPYNPYRPYPWRTDEPYVPNPYERPSTGDPLPWQQPLTGDPPYKIWYGTMTTTDCKVKLSPLIGLTTIINSSTNKQQELCTTKNMTLNASTLPIKSLIN